jgi:hypothetical protein
VGLGVTGLFTVVDAREVRNICIGLAPLAIGNGRLPNVRVIGYDVTHDRAVRRGVKVHVPGSTWDAVGLDLHYSLSLSLLSRYHSRAVVSRVSTRFFRSILQAYC